MIFPRKQKPIKRYARSIALIVLVAVFSSACLLPVSEARAQAGKIIYNISAKEAKNAAAAATKGKGKGGVLSGMGGSIGSAITIGAILIFVFKLVSITFQFFSEMLKGDAKYYNLNNNFINRGWKMMRDFCNLFFLLALLFIAFCTILQIEKYNAKKNLLTLIIFALLINFSKPIAVFIFDGSQLAMSFFLQNSDTPAKISTASHVWALFKDMLYGASLEGIFDFIAAGLLTLIFTFVYVVTIFCLSLFLLIRIVVIWMLVIVSPFAFFAMILPDFRKMASQWWDALFRYSYVGPAIAFFLWLATHLFDFMRQLSFKTTTTDASSSFQDMSHFLPYMITIVFLFAALMMANSFGIHFSQAITGYADKFMKWAAISALKWGERGLLMKPRTVKMGGKEITFSLSPRAWIKGWQEHSAEIDRRALEQAMAHPRDVLSAIFKRGERPKTFYRDVLFSRLEAEKMKEIESVSVESSYMFKILDNAKKTKTREAQAAATAALKILAKNNDQDDYMIDYHGEAHDPLKAKQRMKEDLMAAGLSEHEIGKIFYQLGGIALPSGNMGYWGMSSYDKNTGMYKILDDERQLGKIRAKAQTFETQQLAKVLHRNALMLEDGDWFVDPITGKKTYKNRTFKGVHDVGRVLADILGENEAALEQFKGRGKVDTLAAVGSDRSHWSAEETRRAAQELRKAAEQLQGIAGKEEEMAAKYDRANHWERQAESVYVKFGDAAYNAYHYGKSPSEEDKAKKKAEADEARAEKAEAKAINVRIAEALERLTKNQ